MNKDQLQFLVSGILFGFLLGYVIAYAVHEPKVVQQAAAVPAAGNMGMGQSVPAVAGQDQGAGAAGGGNEKMMAAVFQEIKGLKAAIDQNPKDAVSLIRLANMYHDARKYEEAVQYYKKGLEVTPKDVDARTDMGICLYEMGMADDAIAQFRTSLSYDSRHWQTWLNLGIVALSSKNDVKTATDAFSKVEEINPGFKDLPMLKDALKKAASTPPRQAS
jgi:Flp pilus assembly protein TadD